MSSIPLTVCAPTPPSYQPERECSLGYRLSRSFYRGRIIAAQRRVERHQAIVSGMLPLTVSTFPGFPPSLFI